MRKKIINHICVASSYFTCIYNDKIKRWFMEIKDDSKESYLINYCPECGADLYKISEDCEETFEYIEINICKHCKKPESEHTSKQFGRQCPVGAKHRNLGYTQFGPKSYEFGRISKRKVKSKYKFTL